MRLLYSFGILIYTLAVNIAALWNEKARQLRDGWNNAFRFISKSPVGYCKTAWFHASSLGEFEQGRPVISAFRKEHPDYKVCLTFFSPSGYEVRKNYPEADFVCYLPPDSRQNALRFINMVNPSVAFFIKYDFWFNYLEQLRSHNVPTYIFSTIFRPNQYFFQWYGTWFRRQLERCFSHIFVQNEESLQLLKNHGINHCSVAGDTRFDRVHTIAQENARNEVVEQFLALHPGKHVILAGSSWEPDEEHLHRYLSHRPDTLLILAPHMIGESHLTHIESLFGKKNCLRYSQINNDNENQNENQNKNENQNQNENQNENQNKNRKSILIIDNFGLLSSLYRYADVAYIGGGFGQGIHNTLEAITFGKPVVFGPNYRKFQEAHDIIRLGGGFSYEKYDHLPPILDTLLLDPEARSHASTACLDYMNANLGSTHNILSNINLT